MTTTKTDLPDELARRVWVCNVRPRVGDGDLPIKRTVGETVAVTADLFCDGHDKLAAVVRHKARSAAEWREVAMAPEPNDVWRAEFRVDDQEPHQFFVEAWVDHFSTWRAALEKKAAAGQDVGSELLEGAALVDAASARARGEDRSRLVEAAGRLAGDRPQAERIEQARADELGAWMARHDERRRATRSEPYTVEVSRARARFGAWYEFFPRSVGSGTLRDAAGRLPDIARMGFDVVYLPPIHPIGRTQRKGPNNTLEATADAPGSPWAIGSEAGGHTAVHPDLGGLDDFDHFRREAERLGLEVALDVAFQCSPDHPWVLDHPQWFKRRPDGTIKHAENPPKSYQDIYPLDFDTDDWRALWYELLGVVAFWVDRGVRIFRVDNPHTKPIRFWGWLISEIKRRHPDTIFLSEAFTRPKVMYALAQVGFDQSYTYFTWRNSKQDLIDYSSQLTRTEVRDFLRPNLWPNTPDILPEYLQIGGRPAFMSRLVLAATLGASYGIYAGYELCENESLAGREEYLNSEKFEIKQRDWDWPGNLRGYIARVNRIRRENPALAYDHRLRFHDTDNEQLLVYSKTSEDLSNVIVVAVNLDPHHVHHGWVELSLDELGIDRDQDYQVHDLLGQGRYLWRGPRNYLRLDPESSPAQIFRVRRRLRTEQDFDYFS
ncbi:MAG TPA: alpha-1,4-glucan--maltose-1-phosphate maltosyltransferase [Candidatus Polarisedimenticolaceae bacterium]|nr:alpha-1,4-glucan--maltose-1-phosphate maltosyltransferase [Candidatus Polarisedimenticolaceae bacterium]